MFKSKFNLYNSEWLELVFSNRNKNYGAYELRKHYNQNMLKALIFTATVFTAAIFLASVLTKHAPPLIITKPFQPEVVVNLSEILPQKTPASTEKKVERSETHSSGATQKVAVQPEVFKPVKDELAKTEPKTVAGQSSVSGVQDIPGDISALNAPAGNGSGTNTGKTEDTGNNLVPFTTLEKLPEFPGGMEGWAKFLSKNLHYPEFAAQEGVSGKVYVSFIVEKDGRITDIQVIKGAGFGFDEEAKRVLKMAPQWKPGIQNGKTVRVRYTIPINFTISQ